MKLIKRKLAVQTRSLIHRTKGIFNPIPYYSILDTGDYTPFLGTSYMDRQKFGNYDTDDCWIFSTAKTCIELQLNVLWPKFSSKAQGFFRSVGLATADGKFTISERFYGIKSGNLNNGGTAEELFQLIQTYGLIPEKLLDYTDAQAYAQPTYQDFLNDYFNPKAITQAMLDTGEQTKMYFTLQYQRIGKMWQTPDKTLLSGAMKQAPLAYGVPVNVDTWNQTTIPVCIDYRTDHEVGGYKMTQNTVGYPITDNYIPYLKVLADGYGLYTVSQAVITITSLPAPIPQPQLTVWQKVWLAVMNWYYTEKARAISLAS